MDQKKAIQTLEKYKRVSLMLELQEDARVFDELLILIDKNIGVASSVSFDITSQKRNKYGEEDFGAIISKRDIDLKNYEIDSRIIEYKDNIIDFWYPLNDEEKNQFTIFELNLALYLLSSQYSKYQKKDKRKIIALINGVVKDKRMEASYKGLVV